MPPKTRSTKTSKLLKENIGSIPKTKLKGTVKVTKPARKALSDKTNSASDDNASVEIPKKVTLNPTVTTIKTNVSNDDPDINTENRLRRNRRLPKRYVENEVLKNLSNRKENVSKPEDPVAKANKLQSPEKNTELVVSPFKTPNNDRDTSLTVARPKRVCRLPSRFEEHSVSPNKFIPLQPSHASTPLVQTNDRNFKTDSNDDKSNTDNKNDKSKSDNTPAKKEQSKKLNIKRTTIKKVADTNNNAKQCTTLRKRKEDGKNQLSPPKTAVNRKELKRNKKPLDKNFSFRVLENEKLSLNHDESNLDIYEFTYDPNEEPPPQKKKRKRVATKKPTKPKQKAVLFFNDNYNKNISKTLAALKNVVSQKPNQRNENIDKLNTQTVIKAQHNLQVPQQDTVNTVNTSQNNENNLQMNFNGEKESQGPQNTTNKPNLNTPAYVSNPNNVGKIPEKNASIRVEDIAADFELSLDQHEMDYSPIHSLHPVTPNQPKGYHSTEKSIPYHNDPLNLRDDPSFFEDQPAASSSMNTSVRHPQASPWRCEFQNLPIKWHVNSYVKPNMTPAVECSFVNFDDDKKKHVYTDLVPHTNDTLPEIVEKDAPNLVQKSIISFIKEVAEKKANKKRGRSATPFRSIFEDIPNEAVSNDTDNANKTSKRLNTPKKNTLDHENSAENISNENETSKSSRKCKNNSDDQNTPAKTPGKENDKRTTFFGFDDTENQDQENISPKNNVDSRKLRDLRPRAKAVLKEINEQAGPFRAMLLVVAKTKAPKSHADELFDAVKSATDVPVFPEKNIEEDKKEVTDVNQVSVFEEMNDDDSQSVHLFEDIELLHHLKPLRKSYGKAKKVAFRQRSLSDSDTQDSQDDRAEPEESGEEDDLADLTFEIPIVEQKRVHKKKTTKRQKQAKKEEQEAEAWAAGFNSMCEDVEEFPLVVE